MKFNLKMIAAAAALVATAGTANAALTTTNTDNGSLFLTAFNTVTNDWYVRDLGFTMNQFAPNFADLSVGNTAFTGFGTQTPNAGLTITKGATNTATTQVNFADASFAAFAGSVANQANIRWMVTALDTLNPASNRSRLITSSANDSLVITDGQMTNFVDTSAFGGIAALAPISLSGTFLASAPGFLADNGGLGSTTLATLGQDVGLFYFARFARIGFDGASPGGAYGNASGLASVTLAANGDFSYVLGGAPVSEVPLPAAAWLLGAGLLGLGGAARRRKASTAKA